MPWALTQNLHFAAEAAATVTKNATAATEAVKRMGNAVTDAASSRFEGVLGKIGKSGGFGVPGSSMTGGAELLSMLEDVIRREQKARNDPNTQPMQLLMLQDSIQKIYQLIREWTGAAGQDFTLEKFTKYLADRDAADAAAQKRGSTQITDAADKASQTIHTNVQGSAQLMIGAARTMQAAAQEAAKVIVSAVTGKGPHALKPSNPMLPPVYSGHTPKQPTFNTLLSTLSL